MYIYFEDDRGSEVDEFDFLIDKNKTHIMHVFFERDFPVLMKEVYDIKNQIWKDPEVVSREEIQAEKGTYIFGEYERILFDGTKEQAEEYARALKNHGPEPKRFHDLEEDLKVIIIAMKQNGIKSMKYNVSYGGIVTVDYKIEKVEDENYLIEEECENSLSTKYRIDTDGYI